MNGRAHLFPPLVSLLMLGGLSGFAHAQPADRNQQDEFDRMVGEQDRQFNEFTGRMNREWRAWVQADSIAFAEFRGEVESKWGTYAGTTRKDWIEYDDNRDTRTAVDFEKGEAVVEVLVTARDDGESSAGLDRLREAVGGLVTDCGKTMDYPVLGQTALPLGQHPVLANQLADMEGNTVDPGNAGKFAAETVDRQAVVRTPVASPDGVIRVKLSVTIPLVPRHLRVRAEQYLGVVKDQCRRYNLDPRLVMAMIHTESYFNPKARSEIPAFGLMQLVPAYGGKDAYEFVHGTKLPPTPNYLFDPRNNIELGCAYLHLVFTRYLESITNDLSRLYCGICAYNTGAGNVSRAFTGESRVSAAVRAINGMNPDAVLLKLKSDLPYAETRNYIAKVLERVKYYDEWKN